MTIAAIVIVLLVILFGNTRAWGRYRWQTDTAAAVAHLMRGTSAA